MSQFNFLEDLEAKVSPVADFWQLREHLIPDTPGIYLLLARPGFRFTYPERRSSIYYIGKAESLRHRLRNHLKWHTHVRDDCRTVFPLYEARYEYGGRFGGRYCYIQGLRGRSAKNLEDLVLGRFARRYGTFPVGNGAAAWKLIRRIFQKPNKVTAAKGHPRWRAAARG